MEILQVVVLGISHGQFQEIVTHIDGTRNDFVKFFIPAQHFILRGTHSFIQRPLISQSAFTLLAALKPNIRDQMQHLLIAYILILGDTAGVYDHVIDQIHGQCTFIVIAGQQTDCCA